mgnify:CR=1 FL=1
MTKEHFIHKTLFFIKSKPIATEKSIFKYKNNNFLRDGDKIQVSELIDLLKTQVTTDKINDQFIKVIDRWGNKNEDD